MRSTQAIKATAKPSKAASSATPAKKVARALKGKVPTSGQPIPPGPMNKQTQFIALLRSPRGISIAEAAAALGWQRHSVRGALSGLIKKKLKLKVEKIAVEGTSQRYRLAE
jgi:Protein of unknown function (DUF3489)